MYLSPLPAEKQWIPTTIAFSRQPIIFTILFTMKLTSVPTLFFLALSTLFSLIQADSAVFSQYFGATTASLPSGATQSAYFSICTNIVHGLPALTGISPSESSQLAQEAVDGVCQLCTSLEQSRIDSCCAVASSSACFEQFAPTGKGQKTPATNMATATAAGGGSAATATTKSSGGNRVNVVS